MNKQITIGQLLGSAVSLLMAIVSGWIVLRTEVAELKSTARTYDKRIENVEIKQRAYDQEQREYRDEVLKVLYEIKIELERKENRKN